MLCTLVFPPGANYQGSFKFSKKPASLGFGQSDGVDITKSIWTFVLLCSFPPPNRKLIKKNGGLNTTVRVIMSPPGRELVTAVTGVLTMLHHRSVALVVAALLQRLFAAPLVMEAMKLDAHLELFQLCPVDIASLTLGQAARNHREVWLSLSEPQISRIFSKAHVTELPSLPSFAEHGCSFQSRLEEARSIVQLKVMTENSVL